MKDQIRVLSCDDSAVMRRLINAALKTEPRIQIVAEAKNGKEAIKQLALMPIDLVIMDVEMPVMDGIDAVRGIRDRDTDTPIIMFSSLTSRGAEATMDAMNAGANDFATKPASAGHIDRAMAHVRGELIPKILEWSGKSEPALPKCPMVDTRDAEPTGKCGPVRAIGIGVSTGGPQALVEIFKSLPTEIPVPILIAQHMPPVFTGMLAERLRRIKGHQVREAVDGQRVSSNEVLIAPGDFHLTAVREGTSVVARLDQGPPVNSCRPAVDPLFHSLATCYGKSCLGVVLTGMGKDGTDGAAALRKQGARVFAQDQETSTIWGMPGNVVRCGLADRVLPLQQFGPEIVRLINSNDRVFS